jgi:hypothetical protein
MLADELTGGYGPIHTTYWNGLGNPAVTLPIGLAGGLPLGMHIAGRWFAEATVLRAAHAFQSATDWHRKCPAPVTHLSTIDSRLLRISPYWRSRDQARRRRRRHHHCRADAVNGAYNYAREIRAGPLDRRTRQEAAGP